MWLSPTSFVNPGAGCYILSDAVTITQRQSKPYNPKLVVLAGGTNDISAGEDRTTVSEGIEHLLQTTQVTYPHPKILFSVAFTIVMTAAHAQINMTIDEVNRLAKSTCQRRGHVYIENNFSSSVDTPDMTDMSDMMALNKILLVCPS